MAMRRSLPRGVSWALWILYAIAILTESSHEQGELCLLRPSDPWAIRITFSS
jgi:hypothetical protein